VTSRISAISQRARLLNALLADLYGKQTTLSAGLLPPELVHGHKGFLWPCKGIEPIDGPYLHLYAADLPRFFGYATQVASRYAPLRPLLGLLEPLSGLREITAYSMR